MKMKKLLASALAAAMVVSSMVGAMVASAETTNVGTISAADVEKTYGETDNITAKITIAFNEGLTIKAPHNSVTVALDGYTLASISDPEVTYAAGSATGKVTVEESNLTNGKILLEAPVDEHAPTVTKIEFDANFVDADEEDTAVGTYTIDVNGDDMTDYEEADIAVTDDDGVLTVVAAAPEVTEYSVKFVDADGTVLSEQTVEEGAAAVAPEDPVSSEAHTYFTGWDKDFSNITADTVITAEYINIVFRVKNAALVLAGAIDMKVNVYADVGDLRDEAIEEFGVLAWENDTYNPDDIDFDSDYAFPVSADENITADGYGAYVSRYSFQLADKLNLRAYVKLKNGNIIYGVRNNAPQAIISYSVVDYCSYQFTNSSDTKLKNLLVAMLNYGAKAQLEFVDANLDDSALANSILTDDQKVIPTATITEGTSAGNSKDGKESVGDIANTRVRTASLTLDSVVYINFFANMAPETKAIKKVTALSWLEDDYANAVANGGAVLGTESASSEAFYDAGTSYYKAPSCEIYSFDIRSDVYARMYVEYEDGTTGYTQVFKYSAEFYADLTLKNTSAKQTLKDLVNAMLIYGDYAVAYFA